MKHVRLNKSREARDRARVLRKAMSVSERCFWEAVRYDALGFRCRRQVAMGPYILDFYVPAAKLCIEIDGEQHLERLDTDARRDQYLADHGILTIRIPSLDLFDENHTQLSHWVNVVKRLCEDRALHPPAPSSRKRKEGE